MANKFRPNQKPVAGNRLALSYAISIVIATLAVLVGMAMVNVRLTPACGQEPEIGCYLRLNLIWVGGMLVVLTAFFAWCCKLGWQWALASLALLLGLLELVTDTTSSWMLLTVLIPLPAALLSDPSLPKPKIRLAITLVLVLVTVGFAVWTITDILLHPGV